MEIRKGQIEDLDQMQIVLEDAKNYLKELGLDQWQGEYPNRNSLEEDIKNNQSYVAEDDGKIIAIMAICGLDSNYSTISQGRWISDFDYITVHRIAIGKDNRGKHLSEKMIRYAIDFAKERNIRSIRIDTHKDNKIMRQMLKSMGFSYCGVIKLIDQDSSERLAYEKLIIEFQEQDYIRLKKPHPCKNDVFQIQRVGSDMKLQCLGCGSEIWLDRSTLRKRVKKRLTKEEAEKMKKK